MANINDFGGSTVATIRINKGSGMPDVQLNGEIITCTWADVTVGVVRG